jgi:hypothetical protein
MSQKNTFDFRRFSIYIKEITFLTAKIITHFFTSVEGKMILWSDLYQFKVRLGKIVEHKKKTGKERLWMEKIVSGKPACRMSSNGADNLMPKVHEIMSPAFEIPSGMLITPSLGSTSREIHSNIESS